MITLVCDTSNSTCCAGIYKDGKALASRISFEKRTHSETFMPLVMEVIKESGINREEINEIACVVGPGSFTGIRIGLSFVKGLSYALNVPCISVSSTMALAASSSPVDSIKEALILACFDARNKRVFAGIYNAQNEAVIAEDAYAAADLAEEVLKLQSDATLIVVGDGANVMKEALEEKGISALYAEGSITAEGVFKASLNKPRISGAEISASYCAQSSAERLRK